MRTGQITCSACTHVFAVPANARAAICPRCGQALPVFTARIEPTEVPPPAREEQITKLEGPDDEGAPIARVKLKKQTAEEGSSVVLPEGATIPVGPPAHLDLPPLPAKQRSEPASPPTEEGIEIIPIETEAVPLEDDRETETYDQAGVDTRTAQMDVPPWMDPDPSLDLTGPDLPRRMPGPRIDEKEYFEGAAPAGKGATPSPAVPGGQGVTPSAAAPRGKGATPPPALPGGKGATPPPALPGGKGTTPPPVPRGGKGTTPPPVPRGGKGATPPPVPRGGKGVSLPPAPGGSAAPSLAAASGGAASLPSGPGPTPLPGGTSHPPPPTPAGAPDLPPFPSLPGEARARTLPWGQGVAPQELPHGTAAVDPDALLDRDSFSQIPTVTEMPPAPPSTAGPLKHVPSLPPLPAGEKGGAPGAADPRGGGSFPLTPGVAIVPPPPEAGPDLSDSARVRALDRAISEVIDDRTTNVYGNERAESIQLPPIRTSPAPVPAPLPGADDAAAVDAPEALGGTGITVIVPENPVRELSEYAENSLIVPPSALPPAALPRPALSGSVAELAPISRMPQRSRLTAGSATREQLAAPRTNWLLIAILGGVGVALLIVGILVAVKLAGGD